MTEASTSSIKLANEWNNRRIRISAVGGTIQVHNETCDVTTSGYNFPESSDHTSSFIIRASTEIPGAVAFQVSLPCQKKEEEKGMDDGNNDNDDDSSCRYYLTVPLYGDKPRKDAANELALVPNLQADIIPLIVDYAIEPTKKSFEGIGFNYSSMYVLRNKTNTPTKFQLFTLESVPTCNRFSPHVRFGIRSLFGTYWRSQHWVGRVSQSPHLLDDETWRFYPDFEKVEEDSQ